MVLDSSGVITEIKTEIDGYQIFRDSIESEEVFEEYHEIESEDETSTVFDKKDELFAKYDYLLKGKHASYQYVPIMKTLKALFLQPEICKVYFENISSTINRNRMITSFYESDNFGKNTLFSFNFENIQLNFFIDGYSNGNPLDDERDKFKVTPVQFKIGNLSRSFQG